MKRRKRRIPEKLLREIVAITIAYVLDVGEKTKGGMLSISFQKLSSWLKRRGLGRKLKRGVPWRHEFIKIFGDAVIGVSRHASGRVFLLDREKAIKKAEELLEEFPEAKELLLSEVAVKR